MNNLFVFDIVNEVLQRFNRFIPISPQNAISTSAVGPEMTKNGVDNLLAGDENRVEDGGSLDGGLSRRQALRFLGMRHSINKASGIESSEF